MSREKKWRSNSKFLSLILRHKPESVGLSLDAQGWAQTEALLEVLSSQSRAMSLSELQLLVANNDKKRFEFSPDGTRIRASQGHSLKVDLQLQAITPPDELFHGTVEKYMSSILRDGLIPGSRHHVHLSDDTETARRVGSRRGKAIILKVAAGKMHERGFSFYRSANGVWLTDRVPTDFLKKCPG